MKTNLLKFQVWLWCLMLFVVFHTTGQTANQYGFTTVNNASLALDRNGNAINMSSGTVQLVGASQDDVASSATTIGSGFTFRFFGTNYTQFSVNSNGGIRLGGSAIGNTTIGTSFPVSGQAILAPYLQDIETHSGGKIHYKVVGTSPNRTLVIEFLQMRINFTSTTNDATFQARLYETSNIIEYVYGSMSVGSTSNGGGSNSDARNAVIGFSNTTGTNNQFSLNQSTYATNTSSSPTTNNNNNTGAITGLNSSADGSRRSFTFTPPAVTTGTISGSTFCAGQLITVPFTSVGVYSGNTYTAELSSSTGSFASPTSIGTLVSNANSGNISATIPAGATAGTGYRIRVSSSNANVLLSDNGSNLTINTLPSVSAGSSVCVGNTITISPTTGGTWVSNSPLVASVTNAGVVTGLTGGSSTFTFTNSTTGCSNTTGSVTVNTDATLSQTSALGTENQTKCINTAITSITYSVGGGGTGATVTGLPSGVNGSYNSGTKVYTISGTPNVSGTFNYTVNTTGPCGNTSLGGAITVTAASTISLTSGVGSNIQTRCINNAISDITYSIGGTGTGASATGLPAGVSGVFNAGIFTISGTPTASGTFNYTVNTAGPCNNPSLGGTITVNSLPSVTLGTNASTICIGQSATLTAGNSGGNINYVYSASNNTAVNIPDGSSSSYTYSSINLSAGSAVLASTDLLQVTMNISHSNLSDLDIFLVDPSGTRAILLTTDNGGSGNNYTNTVLSTLASNVIGSTGNTSAPFTGTYRPEGTINTTPDRSGAAFGGNYNSVVPASALNGAAINGNWTLRVFDDNLNFTSGTINNWSLSITQPGAYLSVFNGPATIIPATPSGTNTNPTAAVTPAVGVHSYTVTTTDVNGCSTTSVPVTITVQDNGTIGLSSAELTDAQTVCINTAISDITYTIGGTATGATITAGALPAGVTAAFASGVLTISGTATESGVFNYTVSATGSPCMSPSLNGSITVRGVPVVSQISGPTGACAHIGNNAIPATFTVSTTDPASSYTWNIPNGATSVSGLGTSTVSFKYPNNYNGGNIAVTVTGTCGAPENRNIAIGITPPVTPTIAGIKNICDYVGSNNTLNYSVGADPNARGYEWILPPHIQLISTSPDARAITVSVENNFGNSPNKQIRARALSGCGNSNYHIVYLTAQYATTPSPISGPTDICSYLADNSEATYVIRKVNAASTYIWNFTDPNVNVSHPNGAGENDTIVKVTFGPAFQTTQLTVRSVNDCGTSSARSLTINRSAPFTPGLVTGPTNGCAYIMPGGSVATYSIRKMSTATSYAWTTPADWVVTHQNTPGGINDTLIFVQFPSGFTGGTMSVTASNGCGTSAVPRNLAVGKLNPATPGVIDVIQTEFCPNRVYTYTIASMPSNASGVVWTAPAAGTIIGGQGTSSITVSYPNTAVAGNVTVQSLNNCGNSVVRVSTVKLPACPADFTASSGQSYQKGNVMNPETGTGFGSEIFPNPTVNDFKLRVTSLDKNAQVTVRLLDLQGRELSRMIVMPDALKSFGSDLKAGTYFIEVLQGGKRIVQKVVKM